MQEDEWLMDNGDGYERLRGRFFHALLALVMLFVALVMLFVALGLMGLESG